MNTPTTLPLVSHYISARKLGRLWRDEDLPEVWKMLTQDLTLISLTFSFKIQALVLMPDRFDLLFGSVMPEVQPTLRELLRRVNHEIAWRQLGRGYGPTLVPTRVGTLHHAKFVYKYVYRGPVRASLSPRPEIYPYSTLAGLCGRVPLPLPMAADELLFTPNFNFGTMEWLNTPSEAERMRGDAESVNVC